MNYLAIFVGSGLGGMARFALSTTVQRLAGDWLFPVGTTTVNIIGCLIIGVLAQLFETRLTVPPEQRLFLTVGFLGGFTTFSTFGYETIALLRDGQILYACCNVFLQVVVGLLAVWLGHVLGRLV
jgi:CrcB protein